MKHYWTLTFFATVFVSFFPWKILSRVVWKKCPTGPRNPPANIYWRRRQNSNEARFGLKIGLLMRERFKLFTILRRTLLSWIFCIPESFCETTSLTPDKTPAVIACKVQTHWHQPHNTYLYYYITHFKTKPKFIREKKLTSYWIHSDNRILKLGLVQRHKLSIENNITNSQSIRLNPNFKEIKLHLNGSTISFTKKKKYKRKPKIEPLS